MAAARSPIDFLTGQVLHRCLQRPPSPDEQAWVDDAREAHARWFPAHVWEDWDTQEARRLYWEHRLGLSDRWTRPDPALFPDDPAWLALCAEWADALIEQEKSRDRP